MLRNAGNQGATSVTLELVSSGFTPLSPMVQVKVASKSRTVSPFAPVKVLASVPPVVVTPAGGVLFPSPPG